MTGSDGSFTISGTDYTCPGTGAPVYITASGGNPGLSDTTTDNGQALCSWRRWAIAAA